MNLDIARAWKDEIYRQSLDADELALLPENPAGSFELSEDELMAVHGAGHTVEGRGGASFNMNTALLICLQSALAVACLSLACGG